MADREGALELLRTDLMDELLELLEYTGTKILDATRQHGDLVAVLVGELNEYMAYQPAEQLTRLPALATKAADLLRSLVDEHDVVDDDTAELLDDLLGRLSDCSVDAGVIDEDEPPPPPSPESDAQPEPRERLSVLYPANPPEQPAPQMSAAMVPPQAPRLEAKVPLAVAPLRAPVAPLLEPEPKPEPEAPPAASLQPEAAAAAGAAPAPAPEPGLSAAPQSTPESAPLPRPTPSSPPLSPTAGVASGVETPAPTAAPSNIDAAALQRRVPPPSVERTSSSAASAAVALRALRGGRRGSREESAPEELARLLLVGELFATLERGPEAQAERAVKQAPPGTLGSGTMISFLSVVLSATRGLYYTPTEAEILAIYQSVPFDDDAQRWISRGAFVEWVRGHDCGALWADATLSAIHEHVCSIHDPVHADDYAASPLGELKDRMAEALASPTPTRRELELGAAAPAAAPAAARFAYDAQPSVHPSLPTSVHDLVSSPHHLKAIMLSMDQLQAEWKGRASPFLVTGEFAAGETWRESAAYASSCGIDGSALPSTPAPTKRSEGDCGSATAPPGGVGALLMRIAELEAENTRLNAILTPEKAKNAAPAPIEEWSLLAADLQAEIAAEAAMETSVPADAATALRLMLEESQSVGERVALDLLSSVNSRTGAVTVDSIEEQTRMLEELRLATEKAEHSLEDALAVQKRHKMSGDEARRSEREALERELRIATKALM